MSTELCDFVKLILDRMDTNPEEFIEGDTKHRWGTLVRGIVDWVMGETDTSSARSLWALEPHEREAITNKYKAIYLESQKRAFLKNILGADENQGKKLNITKRSSAMSISDMTEESLKIMQDHLTMSSKTNTVTHTLGQADNAYITGWRDPREPNK